MKEKFSLNAFLFPFHFSYNFYFYFQFLFNNQPDALIIQIYSVIKLHVSGIFSAHQQEFSTVHSALVSFMQVSDDRFQAESRWYCSSILTVLGSGHQIYYDAR
jgi:hypothetical protein